MGLEILMDKPSITAITCTGHRPEAMKLLTKFMVSQTFPIKDIQWLIVDDSLDPMAEVEPIPEFHPSSRRMPGMILWKPGYNTHRLNVMQALRHIQGEMIFFPEDDDFLAKDFFKDYAYFLERFDLCGEANCKYYYLPTHVYKEIGNYSHSSLISTAFNKNLLPIFEKALHSGEPYFDLKLWDYAKEEKVNFMLFVNKNLSIGIKGMPGRKGIGLGHRPEGWDSDPFGKKLMEWLPDNWQDYKPYIGLQRK